MSTSNRAGLFVMAAAFLFIGGIGLAIGGSALLEDWRYRRQAVRAPAIVTGTALRPATDDSNTVYEVSYRFTRADGQADAVSQPVSVHVWERVARDATVQVEYLPGQPASARVVEDTTDQTLRSMVALAIGTALALAGLAAITAMFRRRSAHPGATPDVTPSASSSSAGAGAYVSFWSLASRSFGVWFGGIFVLVALPFAVVSAYRAYDDWRFAREAQSTPGMVLTKEIKRSGKGNKTKRYEATYRFTVHETRLEGRDELFYDTWAKLRERQPAEVRYRPARPSANRLAGAHPWFVNLLLGVLGVVLTVVGSTFVVGAIRSAWLASHLQTHGVKTSGTVTNLHERNLKIGGEQQWRLHYEYRDYQGRRFTNEADLGASEAQTWTVGDTGRVVYDPAKPGNAIWLGLDVGR